MYVRYCCGIDIPYKSQKFNILVKITWIEKSYDNTFWFLQQGWASAQPGLSKCQLFSISTEINITNENDISVELLPAHLCIKNHRNWIFCEIFVSLLSKACLKPFALDLSQFFFALFSVHNIWCQNRQQQGYQAFLMACYCQFAIKIVPKMPHCQIWKPPFWW